MRFGSPKRKSPTDHDGPTGLRCGIWRNEYRCLLPQIKKILHLLSIFGIWFYIDFVYLGDALLRGVFRMSAGRQYLSEFSDQGLE
jgi:hypothetical protein